MSGPGTFFGLEIARRGIQAERYALDVTGHNLTNAGTEGYSRQEAVHAATEPYSLPVFNQKLQEGQLGTGVEISQVRRFRDLYLDNQWREVAGTEGYWEGLEDTLKKVEAVFPEPTEHGMQNTIAKFFNTWHDLNSAPQDIGIKAAVREAAFELTVTFRQTHAQLSDVRQNIDNLVNEKVARINTITQEITEVSTAIAKVKALGQQPNDLLDKRDLLLDELGKLGRLSMSNSDEGYVSVTLYDQELVSIENNRSAITREDAEGWAGESQETGMVAGYIVSLGKIDDYTAMLDELAVGLTNTVNTLHAVGGGKNFFAATGAADFNLHEDVTDQPGESRIANVNGNQALYIAGKRTELTMLGNTTTFEGFYRGLTTIIGADMQGAADRLGTQGAVKEQVNSMRESLTGVSTDEELTKMLQYQYAYQASSRVVTVMDSLLDTLINRTAV